MLTFDFGTYGYSRKFQNHRPAHISNDFFLGSFENFVTCFHFHFSGRPDSGLFCKSTNTCTHLRICCIMKVFLDVCLFSPLPHAAAGAANSTGSCVHSGAKIYVCLIGNFSLEGPVQL